LSFECAPDAEPWCRQQTSVVLKGTTSRECAFDRWVCVRRLCHYLWK